MKSDSWASYQSALPIEARAGGEPDDDDRKPTKKDLRRWRDEDVVSYAVMYMSDIGLPSADYYPEPMIFRHFEVWTSLYHVAMWYAAMVKRNPGKQIWVDEVSWDRIMTDIHINRQYKLRSLSQRQSITPRFVIWESRVFGSQP